MVRIAVRYGLLTLACVGSCGRSGLETPDAADASVAPVPDSGVFPSESGVPQDAAQDSADAGPLPPPPRWLVFEDEYSSSIYATRVTPKGFGPSFPLGDALGGFSWSPDGRFLALKSAAIRLVSFADEEPSAAVVTDARAWRFHWSPSQPLALSSAPDARYWSVVDARGEEPLVWSFDLDGPPGTGADALWAPDGVRALVTCGLSQNQTFLVDTTNTAAKPRQLEGPYTVGQVCAWSRDNRWAVCEGDQTQVGLILRAYYAFDTEASPLVGTKIPGSDCTGLFGWPFAFAAHGWLIHTVAGSDELRALRVPEELNGAPTVLDKSVVPEAWSVSPDGQRVAYCGTCGPGGAAALCVRELNEGAPGPPVAYHLLECSFPRWSPDSRHVTYYEGLMPSAPADLWLVEVAGSTFDPVQVTDADFGFYGWSPDERWLTYQTASNAVLWRVGSATKLVPFAAVKSVTFVEWASDTMAVAGLELLPGGGGGISVRFLAGDALTKELSVEHTFVGWPRIAWQPMAEAP